MSPNEIIEVRGVLFDMDGVLVDSTGSAERCWHRWAVHFGVPNADKMVLPHGIRAVDIMERLKPDVDKVEGLRFIEDIEIADTVGLRVLPGVRELLQHLPSDRWAIVTSATRRLLLARLGVAQLPIPERVISAELVTRGKPDPEPYQRGAELVGATPSDCVVVEDAPSGVKAGLLAGCRVLGVEGTHNESQLREAGATWVVSTLEHVAAQSRGDGITLTLQSR
ncbi:MAG: HAD-IA family hydrolase [Janthinobacterium lividum]